MVGIFKMAVMHHMAILLLLYFTLSTVASFSVSIPRDNVSWSADYDCGISWSYSLTFWRLKGTFALAKSRDMTVHSAYINTCR